MAAVCSPLLDPRLVSISLWSPSWCSIGPVELSTRSCHGSVCWFSHRGPGCFRFGGCHCGANSCGMRAIRDEKGIYGKRSVASAERPLEGCSLVVTRLGPELRQRYHLSNFCLGKWARRIASTAFWKSKVSHRSVNYTLHTERNIDTHAEEHTKRSGRWTQEHRRAKATAALGSRLGNH